LRLEPYEVEGERGRERPDAAITARAGHLLPRPGFRVATGALYVPIPDGLRNERYPLENVDLPCLVAKTVISS